MLQKCYTFLKFDATGLMVEKRLKHNNSKNVFQFTIFQDYLKAQEMQCFKNGEIDRQVGFSLEHYP